MQRQQQCFICAKVQRQQQQSAQPERKSTPRYNMELLKKQIGTNIPLPGAVLAIHDAVASLSHQVKKKPSA